MKRICECGKSFTTYKKDPSRGKFCSKVCMYKFRNPRPNNLKYDVKVINKGWIKKGECLGLGRKWSKETLEKISLIRKGKHNSPETEFKKGFIPWNKDIEYLAIIGEKHPAWKGNEVGYNALHSWVSRNLGKPKKCEYCEKDNLTGKKIHWANKSGKYLRNLNDWIRLCVPCHKEYDLCQEH